MIDSAVVVFDSSSVPRLGERVMVCGVANASAVSKTIVFGAGLAILAGLALVLTLAQPMAARSVPTSNESAVLVTRYDELAS